MLGLRRLVTILAISSVFVWLGSVPAGASNNPHDRTPLPLPVPNPYVAPLCGADLGPISVGVDVNSFRAAIKFFSLPGGETKIQVNGFQSATVQGNGKTLHLNISGPGYLILAPDGTLLADVGEGHGLYIGPPGTPQPGLLLFTGRVVFAASEIPGVVVVQSFSGSKTDICALLR